MNTNSNQTIEGEYKDITPNHLVSQNISHTLSKIIPIKNKPPLLIEFSKFIESKKGKITVDDINLKQFNLYGNKVFSLISVLYFYKYDDIAKELLDVEGIHKNEIDIFVGKLHFLIDRTPYKAFFHEYVKIFILHQNINAIPDGYNAPLLHYLVDLYLERPSKIIPHLVLSFIEDNLIRFPGFNINILNKDGYSILDTFLYAQRDFSGDMGYIENFFIEKGAGYTMGNKNGIPSYIQETRERTRSIIDTHV